MSPHRPGHTLRVEPPLLEPDDALVHRLAAVARDSAPRAARARSRGLRVALVSTGFVGLTMTGAWAATSIVNSDPPPAPAPPSPTQVDEPSPPVGSTEPPGTGEPGAAPTDRSQPRGPRGSGDGSRSTDAPGTPGSPAPTTPPAQGADPDRDRPSDPAAPPPGTPDPAQPSGPSLPDVVAPDPGKPTGTPGQPGVKPDEEKPDRAPGTGGSGDRPGPGDRGSADGTDQGAEQGQGTSQPPRADPPKGGPPSAGPDAQDSRTPDREDRAPERTGLLEQLVDPSDAQLAERAGPTEAGTPPR